jgi:hypothetical protein
MDDLVLRLIAKYTKNNLNNAKGRYEKAAFLIQKNIALL